MRLRSITLVSADPFALPPAEIVERMLALSYAPIIEQPKIESWPTIGCVSEVDREDWSFLAGVSRDPQEISAQEMRAEAYDLI